MKNTFSRDGKYKNYWKYLWLIIYCLFFFAPKCAYAGGISALSVLYTSHMLIGNAIIGIFEGLIIARLFGVRLRRSISIMILANYISMIAGAIGIQPLKNTINNHASINNFFPIIIIMLILSYLTTMSIQWFFCFWILKGKEGRGCISLKASIIVNIISYAIFIPFYFSASDISAISNMKIEKSPYFLKTNNAWIYFISLKDGALYKIKANGSDKQRIKDTGSTNQDVELFTCNKDEKTILNAQWRKINDDGVEIESKILLKDLPGLTAVSGACDASRKWWYRNEPAIYFGSKSMRDWDVFAGDWVMRGFRAENKKTGKRFWFNLDAPFLRWSITTATVLPEDQVVCQMGNQIILIDLETRRLGLIAFGKSPIVVLE